MLDRQRHVHASTPGAHACSWLVTGARRVSALVRGKQVLEATKLGGSGTVRFRIEQGWVRRARKLTASARACR